ncbi:hypothetical protein [Sphingomonas japonica]|uniref:Methylmalonyl-CoA mutase cobalamin-binding subunit n=1 Tax=Sphingomonas japonica TaxID=511662 RepID=A0ABX0TZW2_9SPHN|nr:hypothetical protein [Sphingomonas japonica]NIJ22571.1 methylmalonyl-CoA mutase cobalamin-binding subunit [Sphingomonas japonica]
MNFLPLLYALLAALTGFSAEAGPVRQSQVAAASALAVADVAAKHVSARSAREHLADLDRAADRWRARGGLTAIIGVGGDVAALLPKAERPARRRE